MERLAALVGEVKGVFLGVKHERPQTGSLATERDRKRKREG